MSLNQSAIRHPAAERHWHAVFCRARQDSRAEEHLVRQGFETFRPKVRVPRGTLGQRRVFVESLFPRYLFVRLADCGEDWSPIASTRGTIGLVRSGSEVPIVPDELIWNLQDRADADGIVSLVGTTDFRRNDPVEIIDGPCTGYRALFQARTGKERVVVLLDLLKHQQRVELHETMIRRV